MNGLGRGQVGQMVIDFCHVLEWGAISNRGWLVGFDPTNIRLIVLVVLWLPL